MTYSDLFKRDIPPLNERIGAAIDRVTNGQGCMRIPADPTDPDIVLGDCRESIAALSARVAKLEAEQSEARNRVARLEAALGKWQAWSACCPPRECDDGSGYYSLADHEQAECEAKARAALEDKS